MSDSIEITFESLGLTKQLEKMTAKELREVCVAKLPMITGATSMDKDTLVTTIKDVFGLNEEGAASPYKDQISSIKREIKALKAEKEKITDKVKRDAMRKKISTLKKRTRRLAHAS